MRTAKPRKTVIIVAPFADNLAHTHLVTAAACVPLPSSCTQHVRASGAQRMTFFLVLVLRCQSFIFADNFCCCCCFVVVLFWAVVFCCYCCCFALFVCCLSVSFVFVFVFCLFVLFVLLLSICCCCCFCFICLFVCFLGGLLLLLLLLFWGV